MNTTLDSLPVLSYLIEELELGVRAYNILKRMNVNTLGDLARVTPADLQRFYDGGYPGEHRSGIAVSGRTLDDICQAQRRIERLISESERWL